MKRIIAWILALIMCISLVACNNGNTDITFPSTDETINGGATNGASSELDKHEDENSENVFFHKKFAFL